MVSIHSKLVARRVKTKQLAKSNMQLCCATKRSEKVAQLCCVTLIGLTQFLTRTGRTIRKLERTKKRYRTVLHLFTFIKHSFYIEFCNFLTVFIIMQLYYQATTTLIRQATKKSSYDATENNSAIHYCSS